MTSKHDDMTLTLLLSREFKFRERKRGYRLLFLYACLTREPGKAVLVGSPRRASPYRRRHSSDPSSRRVFTAARARHACVAPHARSCGGCRHPPRPAGFPCRTKQQDGRPHAGPDGAREHDGPAGSSPVVLASCWMPRGCEKGAEIVPQPPKGKKCHRGRGHDPAPKPSKRSFCGSRAR